MKYNKFGVDVNLENRTKRSKCTFLKVLKVDIKYRHHIMSSVRKWTGDSGVEM